MTAKRKTKDTDDLVGGSPTMLDKLIDLRRDIKTEDGLTRLLDILIEAEGGTVDADTGSSDS